MVPIVERIEKNISSSLRTLNALWSEFLPESDLNFWENKRDPGAFVKRS